MSRFRPDISSMLYLPSKHCADNTLYFPSLDCLYSKLCIALLPYSSFFEENLEILLVYFHIVSCSFVHDSCNFSFCRNCVISISSNKG